MSLAKVFIVAALPFISAITTAAEGWPLGLSFVGLADDEWQLYVVTQEGSLPERVLTAAEPRTPAFNTRSGHVAYIASDGSLREHRIGESIGDGQILISPTDAHAYTQPAYDPTGEFLYLVQLKEGTSVDTDILRFNASREKVEPVVLQRSAQFDPVVPDAHTLYYSNVLCTVGCGKIIQEIWTMNLISAEAEQLTLLNSISRQPFLSPDGQWLYFSSNKQGNYHVWRLQLASGQYEQITVGTVTDINPVTDGNDNLYFIRRAPQSVQLMRLGVNGDTEALALPESVTDIRDLRMGR